MRASSWAGAVAAVLIASIPAAQRRVPAEVDWRSRAEVGLTLVYEWEREEASGHTTWEDEGTLVDRVYTKDGDDFLGVRVITSTNGGPDSELRFFRLLPSGEMVDDAPLESFCWEGARDDFPHRDALGAFAEFVPGLSRERTVEIRDPMLREAFPDPVVVRETAAVGVPDYLRERYPDPAELQEVVAFYSRFEPEDLLTIVDRRFEPPCEEGIASAEGTVSLLSLHDTATFERVGGVILERTLEFSFLRENSWVKLRRTLREVSAWPLSSTRSDDTLAALALRNAYRSAGTDHRESFRRLAEWLENASRELEDVAGLVWILASRAEREHAQALAAARQALGPVDVAEDDTFEARRRGRLTELFVHLGLEGWRHRTAYRSSLEARGLDATTVEFLTRLHDGAPGPRGEVPEPLRSRAAALMEAEIVALADPPR